VTEHGIPHHVPSWGEALGALFDPVVNFTIFAVVLYSVLRGPLLEYLRDRAVRLRDALDAGATARREAAELRERLEKDLADLPRLRRELRDELVDTAERQRERLVEAARETAARLRRDAETVAGQEEISARTALRNELVAAAVRGATEMVQGAVGPDDQRRFVKDLLDEARAL
jgi:F-type H+-transporting ATPase subunit b